VCVYVCVCVMGKEKLHVTSKYSSRIHHSLAISSAASKKSMVRCKEVAATFSFCCCCCCCCCCGHGIWHRQDGEVFGIE
jgi:hypothetical protein